MRTRLALVTMSLLLASLVTVAFCEQQAHSNFANYHTAPGNGILMPRIGCPAILTSGSSLEVYFDPGSRGGKDWGLRLRSPFMDHEAKVVGVVASGPQSVWKLSAEVPKEARRDLYDLVIYSRQQTAVSFVERNSVFIVGESFPEMLRVGVITDLHYGVGTYYAHTTKVLRRTLDVLSALDLDLVVGSGDIVDATADELSFSSVASEFFRLRVPILLAIGNNDQYAIDKGFRHWEKHLAPEYYSVKFGEYYFLVLNSGNGSIDENQLLWAEKDLSVQPKESFKVLVLHHPYWNEPHPSLSSKLPNLIKTHGIELVLMGHTHRDEVRQDSALNILSVALSDEGAGYRLLNLTRKRVEYDQKSQAYDSLLVNYLQPNDYTSAGFAAQLSNKLATDSRLRLTFFLKSQLAGATPKVDGAELSRVTVAKEPQGKASAEVRLNLPPKTEKVVKVYLEGDKTPPSVSCSYRVEGTAVFVSPSASDVGFGVAKVTVYYSDDNLTWTIIPAKIIQRAEQHQFTATKAAMFLKIEVEDAAGLMTTKYVTVQVPDLQAKKTENIPSMVELTIPVALVAAFVLGVILLRRRKTPR